MCLNSLIKYMGFLFILFFLLSPGCSRAGDNLPTASDFSLEDLSGQPVTLQQYRGKIVLLDFWATWCPPCRKSIPELVELQQKYGDRGVVILGISLDDPRLSNKFLLAFKEKFKINYKILRANQEIVQNYFSDDKMGIPTMFIINRDGKIVKKHMGYVPGAVKESLKILLS